MKTTRDDLKAIRKDVGDLMRFRWMVMGGAAMVSLIFTLIIEMARGMSAPSTPTEQRQTLDGKAKKQVP